MATRNVMPPTLTGGQKSVLQGDELGLQSQFLDPIGEFPDQEDQTESRDSATSDEGVQLALDWYEVTLHTTELTGVPDHEQLQLAASIALGCSLDDWIPMDRGMYGYLDGMIGPGKAQIWWNAPGREDIHASFPGKACGIAGREGLVNFLKYSTSHGGKATRCDTVIDDHRRVVSPDFVLTQIQGPTCVSHANNWLLQRGGDKGSPDTTGITAYLGSPSSRQRLRVYDKGLESDGELDCVRWELESRKEAAETMAIALAVEEWANVIVRRLVGFVDFRDQDHSETEKRNRCDWYRELVGMAKKATAYLPKAARTVEEVIEWLDNTVGPSLAVVVKVWGGDFGPLGEIIRRGRARWKPKHQAMVAAAVG